MEPYNNKSLYERLGGAEGISFMVDDIVDAHLDNPAIKARFLPTKDDPVHFEEVKMQLFTFLSSIAGGPHTYKGKSMSNAHRGMNISPGEYMHVMDDILSVLEKNNVDKATRNEFLGILMSLKDQIVGV